MFKFDTKTMVSVNGVKLISIPSSIVDRVNEISKVEKKYNGVKFNILDDI